MSKALIFVRNPGSQTVAAGGNVALGSVVRRYGNRCCRPVVDLSGDGITISDEGYYSVDVDVTVAPTVAGPVTVSLLQDGVVVFTKTGTAAAIADAVPLTMASPIVRVRCNATSTLTVQLTSGAGTVSEVGVSVVKE